MKSIMDGFPSGWNVTWIGQENNSNLWNASARKMGVNNYMYSNTSTGTYYIKVEDGVTLEDAVSKLKAKIVASLSVKDAGFEL